MSGFIQGEDRFQATLFPESLDDYVAEDSSVRVIDVFLDDLDLSGLGFKTEPNDTGRPAYHPSTMLKLFVYGYLNVGTILVTMFGNVPLNNQLAAESATVPGTHEVWQHYLDRWTMWNHVRTTAAMVAALLYTLGLMQNAVT